MSPHSDKLKFKKMNHLVAEILAKVRYDPPPPPPPPAYIDFQHVQSTVKFKLLFRAVFCTKIVFTNQTKIQG